MLEEIRTYAKEFGAELSEKNGVWTFTKLIAERKVFLSKKKLTYTAKFRIVDESKELKFTEMLKEEGSGLSMGSDFDSDISPGFGFKKEVYKSGMNGREGSIEEQSSLFNKDYDYSFDYKAVRERLTKIAEAGGYKLQYQITSIGL